MNRDIQVVKDDIIEILANEKKNADSNLLNKSLIAMREEAKLEKQKMADDVKKEIVSVAALMAGKVVASSMDVTIQDSLIDETLKEIGDSTWLS